ncbi:MAG: 2-oxoglutarate synthase [Bryobacteraceae bacterium]|nr:MAG: 2-oxoglutarate synthase [Bryobacteraceae bacterium]
MSTTELEVHNPVEDLLRQDRLPTIWCPGCGIGTTVNSFAHALLKQDIDLKKTVIVSGIGCSGRVSGYMNLDSFHTTHGRAIPFATGLKLANPELNVIVYSGDGDLASIGGNHLIHAARRNIDILVVCINNMIYAMTGGQAAATTPSSALSTTTPYGAFEPELNLVQLVDAAGASFVARWTAYHVVQLERTIEKALKKKGFRFIEVLSPCPTYFQRKNNMGDALQAMLDYKKRSKIKHGCPTWETALTPGGDIIVGEFVDREREDYLTRMRKQLGPHYSEFPPQLEEHESEGCSKEC